ncbi:unnamed protein product, partial [Phaeothamnion confervicola]
GGGGGGGGGGGAQAAGAGVAAVRRRAAAVRRCAVGARRARVGIRGPAQFDIRHGPCAPAAGRHGGAAAGICQLRRCYDYGGGGGGGGAGIGGRAGEGGVAACIREGGRCRSRGGGGGRAGRGRFLGTRTPRSGGRRRRSGGCGRRRSAAAAAVFPACGERADKVPAGNDGRREGRARGDAAPLPAIGSCHDSREGVRRGGPPHAGSRHG